MEKGTKNKYRKRNIDLLKPAYIALKKIMPDDYLKDPQKYNSTFIFKNPKTNNIWGNDAITRHWNNTLKSLGISHRRAYETRHTFASIMLTACLPDAWLRAQMGHASMKMLEEVYAKWLGDADNIINWVLKHTQDGKNAADFTKLFLEKYK